MLKKRKSLSKRPRAQLYLYLSQMEECILVIMMEVYDLGSNQLYSYYKLYEM